MESVHMSRNENSPNLGGTLAVSLFIATLLAFVVESQLTQYVQMTLGYRQPFFIFYVVHSSFAIICPLHVLYLISVRGHSISSIWKSLSITITDHLAPQDSAKFPILPFIRLALICTVGLTLPALLWFAAITLASVGEVTAIWNTNAFFAYVIAVKLFGLRWEPRRLLAVLLATLGVIAVVYGGSTADDHEPSVESTGIIFNFAQPSAPLVGDLLTLVASIGYGLYQVLYKKYASISTDPDDLVSDDLYDQLPNEDPAATQPNTPLITAASVHIPLFGLYANFLTSAIGLLTCLILWLPIPLLHYSGVEPFRLPPNLTAILAIAGISLSGVVFNAGFMVLLGIWGPIITSVGNLLTIVLVFISDMIFGAGLESLTPWSVIGCSVIVAAFSVLAYDMFSRRS